jgi:DNA-directed RNA polymerase specialized sigma24 family protein
LNEGTDPGPEGEEHADLERRFRRQADALVIRHLAESGFDPATPEWARVRQALVEYGYSVLRVWLRNGTARRRAVTYGIWRGSTIPQSMRPDDADALAADVVVPSIERFRSRVLATGGWTADGGASIATYFVRFVLMETPNKVRGTRRSEPESAPLDSAAEIVGAEPGADVPVVVESELAEAVALLGDADLVDTFRLLAEGFTYTEIAAMVGRSESSLKSQVMRARAIVRRKGAGR